MKVLPFAGMSPAHEKLWANALEAGLYELRGFLAHDNHKYDETTENFHKSLTHTLPWYDNSVLKQVAREKTEVLRSHDWIEETDNTAEQKLADTRWEWDVLPHAKNEARLLGLDLRYADSKTDFYRLHGQGEITFREKVYDMDKYFTGGITKNPKLYLLTAPIYLTCIAFHDTRRILNKPVHGEISKKMIQFHYADYVFNLQTALDYKTKVLDKLKTIK